jgi:archaemetzincin
MKPLQLVQIGEVEAGLIHRLRTDLSRIMQVECEISPAVLDPEACFHGERQQYHSSELISRLQELAHPGGGRTLGVASVDLYIPILTFVFGEAQMGGTCAVISSYRLRQEFYGLPVDQEILGQRLVKEAVHELGHTLNLTHCEDYECAMAPSHAVEWIDLKQKIFCGSCQSRTAGALVASP